MSSQTLSKNSPIIIIGAGVFGLSSALHLARAGYENVTMYDKQDFNYTGYSRYKGADSPSSDISKIIRTAYATSILYQKLATEAMEVWKSWNSSSSSPLFVNCGWARLNDEVALDDLEVATQSRLGSTGHALTQYNLNDSSDRARAEKDGWGGQRLDQFQRLPRGLPNWGILDSLAGYANADAACRYVLQLAHEAGVQTVFGRNGEYQEFLKTGNRVTGIKTSDGKSHFADLVIVAAGPHSPQLIPGLSSMIKITPTGVFELDVPKQLQAKYRSEVFPVWVWNRKFGGFPVNSSGILKLLYDNTEWLQAGLYKTIGNVSVPISAINITESGFLKTYPPELKNIVQSHFPELIDVNFTGRICWYTDTYDGSFVIDWVPDLDGLLVATGGARHAYKFLPTIGKYVVDVVEGKENDYTRIWKWRERKEENIEARGVPAD